MRLKKYISSVFLFLNERAEYAVLRNYQRLPDDNNSRDIDVFGKIKISRLKSAYLNVVNYVAEKHVLMMW